MNPRISVPRLWDLPYPTCEKEGREGTPKFLHLKLRVSQRQETYLKHQICIRKNTLSIFSTQVLFYNPNSIDSTPDRSLLSSGTPRFHSRPPVSTQLTSSLISLGFTLYSCLRCSVRLHSRTHVVWLVVLQLLLRHRTCHSTGSDEEKVWSLVTSINLRGDDSFFSPNKEFLWPYGVSF